LPHRPLAEIGKHRVLMQDPRLVQQVSVPLADTVVKFACLGLIYKLGLFEFLR